MIRVVIVAVLLSSLALVGCGPRGETKSLSEVYQIAKDRYERAIVDADTLKDTKGQLTGLAGEIDGFLEAAGGGEVRSNAMGITKTLQSLIEQAGYTTRPALNEIIKSYQGIAEPTSRERLAGRADDWSVSDATKQLLVARTYTVLAQELETTSFQVLPKGK